MKIRKLLFINKYSDVPAERSIMERWHVKVLATAITIVLMLIAVFVPFKIVAKFKKLGHRGTRILDTLGCFTGGIFLGTCLLFLVPEVVNLMQQPANSGFAGSYPVAEGIMAIGFVSIMFLERMVHSCRNTKKKPQRTNSDSEDKCEKMLCGESIYLKGDKNCNTQYNSKPDEGAKVMKIEEKLEISEDDPLDEDNEILATENTTKAVILFIALSLDEFLGGISMGLQRTSTAVWGILVGLLAHECVVGFSFGLQLASLSKSRPGCFALVLGLSYALIGPLGAVVGTLIGEMSWSSAEKVDSVNGVLQGLATGVFLYVTFFEILSGKIHSHCRYSDLVAVTVGMAVMALIAAIPKEEPHPDHENNVTISTGLQNDLVIFLNNCSHNC